MEKKAKVTLTCYIFTAYLREEASKLINFYETAKAQSEAAFFA